MGRKISRRDFLNGIPVGATTLMLPGASGWLLAACAEPGPSGPYPPALTGLRGSHPGSFEVAHELRDRVAGGGVWDDSAAADGDDFDLVVVGGGISGLSAAWFYHKAFPQARILVLDNHDDFGGHAKRNEFTHEGRTVLGYGGTQSLDSPSTFSPAVHGLLEDLGIDLDLFFTAFDRDLYRSHGLQNAVFFGSEDFGEDRLVTGMGRRPAAEFAAEAPLSEAARADFIRLHEAPGDPWPELDEAAKKERLAATSYQSFLDTLGMGAEIQSLYRQRTHGLFGMGPDGVPALDLWGLGYPGFREMGLGAGDHPRLSLTAKPNENPDPYIFHFPDGNATIARLLVRGLVPGAAPGNTAEDIVEARLDYGVLDRPDSPCRIRLNSTAVRVREGGDGAASVTYVQGGVETRVRARHVVLACYNRVIPYLMPELPEEQREALAYPPKVPLVYSNVLIRNWTSFVALGASRIYFPGGFHASVSLDFPVSVGGYDFSSGPEDLIVLHAVRTPCLPGASARVQHAAGQHDMLQMDFETFERETRSQLARALGPGGFDPARDILGLTVNRWPHGYAFEFNSLWDPPFAPGEAPNEIGRRPFGRVHIANSDAAAYAYTHAAIDEARRAVSEILNGG
jgi:spermidine dehydrogenase